MLTNGTGAGGGASHVIELRNFSVVYPKFTLAPLSLSFRSGERVALVGPNGAGKSTLLKAVGARLVDYEGDVLLDRVELRKQLPGVREEIGFLPEHLLGYGWMTVQEHMDFLSAFFSSWDVNYAAELLERLRLAPQARIGTLSKGMKVKLSFVTAEAYRPPLLLLDEPTSGLDPVVRREVIDVMLERVPRGGDRLVLFSTHILEDVEWIADRVLVLLEGELEADSSVTDLCAERQGETLSEILYSILRGDDQKAL